MAQDNTQDNQKKLTPEEAHKHTPDYLRVLLEESIKQEMTDKQKTSDSK